MTSYITTGETVIKLEKQLRCILAHYFPDHKMPKFAAIAMVPFTKSYPKPLELLVFKYDVIRNACLNDKQAVLVEKTMDKVFGEFLDIRMKHEKRGKTYETGEKAEKLFSDILEAYTNLKHLEPKIDINLNREL